MRSDKYGVLIGAHPDGTDMDNYGDNYQGRRGLHMDRISLIHMEGLCVDDEQQAMDRDHIE